MGGWFGDPVDPAVSHVADRDLDSLRRGLENRHRCVRAGRSDRSSRRCPPDGRCRFGGLSQTRTHGGLRIALGGKRIQHRVHAGSGGALAAVSAAEELDTPSHTATAIASPEPQADDSRCGGVLVARVFESAIGDEHDGVEMCLVAIRFRAPLTAYGAVLVDVACRHRNRHRRPTSPPSRGGRSRGERRTARRRSSHRTGRRPRPPLRIAYTPPPVHSLVLGRTAFAFSTRSIRAHTSVVSCASAR